MLLHMQINFASKLFFLYLFKLNTICHYTTNKLAFMSKIGIYVENCIYFIFYLKTADICVKIVHIMDINSSMCISLSILGGYMVTNVEKLPTLVIIGTFKGMHIW